MTALRRVPTLMVGSLALASQDINFSVTTKHVKVIDKQQKSRSWL